MKKVLPSSPTECNSVTFKSGNNVRRAIAILIVVTSLNSYLPSQPGVFASPQPTAALAKGIMRVAGIVTIDGARAASSQTIFPGSYIATSQGSESIIDLGKFTRLLLSAETELTLDFSKTHISSSLSKGVVRGFIQAGIPVTIRSVGAEVLTDSSQPTVFIVQVEGDITKVSVEAGRVEVRIGNKRQSVGVGQVFSTASGPAAPRVPASNLTDRQKVGLFGAIAAAAAILVVAIIGRDEIAPQYGDCVIVYSGESSSPCP